MVAAQFHHAPKPAARSRRVYSEPISWVRLLFTTALFSIATGAILMGLDSRHPGTPAAAPVETASEDQSLLGLRVATRNQQVEIRWDHNLVAAFKSGKGLIKITDGDMAKLIPLDWRDLQDGYVAYAPLTNDVRVRLEVTATDGTTFTESARVVAIP
jgi:hypothetical protein